MHSRLVTAAVTAVPTLHGNELFVNTWMRRTYAHAPPAVCVSLFCRGGASSWQHQAMSTSQKAPPALFLSPPWLLSPLRPFHLFHAQQSDGRHNRML